MNVAKLAVDILMAYEGNLDQPSAPATFAERLAAMIKTIEELGIKNEPCRPGSTRN